MVRKPEKSVKGPLLTAPLSWSRGDFRFRHLAEWMHKNLWIHTKVRGFIPFVFNKFQWHLWSKALMQYEAGLPIRIIVLKARQLGVSTFVEGLMFAICQNFPHQFGLVCAHDDQSSQGLFDKTSLFEESLPEGLRHPTKANSRKEIIFKAPHHSKISVQTAGKLRLGRSATYQLLHPSEMAFWNHAEMTTTSVMQSVPNEPETMIIIESTAFGVGGEYCDRWDSAKAQHRIDGDLMRGFLPVFFPCTANLPEYSIPLGANEEIIAKDDDEIEWLAEGWSPEQVKWRRYSIEQDCGGNVDLWKREYPHTPEEAFRETGRRAIPERITKHHRSTVEVPMRARFEWDETQACGVRVDIDETFRTEYWQVWKFPNQQHDYTVGGDVMEGRQSDVDDDASDQDWSAAFVLDRFALEQVAAYWGRPDPDIFGQEMLKVACYYNFAWATPEANSPGIATILQFKRKNYSRTYQREQSDDKVDVADSPYVGWKTHTGNRDHMIDDWKAWCRPDPVSKFHDKMIIRSENLVEEEETFTYDNRGKREHRAGKHDDELFAAMIALQLHIRCPRTKATIGPQMFANKAARRANERHLSYRDAVDWGIEAYDDGDDFTE